MRVFVVDDDAAVRESLGRALRLEGYDVELAADGSEALERLESDGADVDLVVLDVLMPAVDGLEVCRRLRRNGSRLPVLMLTARDDDLDKIAGLEVGADDYLTKPFNPRELVARVRAILRRGGGRSRPEAGIMQHGELVLDAGRRECRVGDEEIRLAPKEFDLLWELLDHRGLVLTRDQLLERVWGYTFAGDTRTVDVHVRQLRRKLGDAAPIVTVWGIGYKAAPAPASTG